MAYHTSFSIPERDLGNYPIEIVVRKNDSRIGRVRLTKAGIEWLPKNKKQGTSLKWVDFAAMMEKE